MVWNALLQSVFSMEGDKLVQVQKWNDKETKFVREIKDGKMVMVRGSAHLGENLENGWSLQTRSPHLIYSVQQPVIPNTEKNLFCFTRSTCLHFPFSSDRLWLLKASRRSAHTRKPNLSKSSQRCNLVFDLVLQHAADCTEILLSFCKIFL